MLVFSGALYGAKDCKAKMLKLFFGAISGVSTASEVSSKISPKLEKLGSGSGAVGQSRRWFSWELELKVWSFEYAQEKEGRDKEL